MVRVRMSRWLPLSGWLLPLGLAFVLPLVPTPAPSPRFDKQTVPEATAPESQEEAEVFAPNPKTFGDIALPLESVTFSPDGQSVAAAGTLFGSPDGVLRARPEGPALGPGDRQGAVRPERAHQ